MTEATLLLRTQSCYVGVFDKASPAYFEGLIKQEFAGADEDVAAQGLAKGWSLFGFNGRLIDRSRKGELLVWTLLFDGVYKARVQIGPDITEPESLEPVDQVGWPTDLWCPTGQIVVACLGSAGDQSIEPIVHVEPGSYRASVEQHECEWDHTFLEELRDYPPADGPDWTITLARLRD